MNRFTNILCLFLAALMVQGFIASLADAWDIVGLYEYKDKNYNYLATITVTGDYKIILESSIAGGICGFVGQIRDKDKKKIVKQLSAGSKSITALVWNGLKGDESEDFIFQFTPDTVILKKGTTLGYNYYCGAMLQLPDESEIFKRVK